MIKVLVVDDSALARNVIKKGLELSPDITVVGTASDPFVARDKIVQLKPDVITLDVEMPRMDGLEFLRRLMPQHPLPVVMVSSLTRKGATTTLDALASGAVDFVTKPTIDIANGIRGMITDLQDKVKVASKVDLSRYKQNAVNGKKLPPVKIHSLAESTDKVVAIGASTGGTEALAAILERLPANTPGTVIVQHMPPGFTKRFAERLNSLSAMEVKEGASGDRVMTGTALIAPGGRHMQLIRSGGTYRVKITDEDRVCGHKPSVEVLFRSAAKCAGKNAIGIMLTGMGSDGADGMVAMKKSGARTFAQDQATSVVFGMPKVAYNRGGAERLVPLPEIPNVLRDILQDKK